MNNVVELRFKSIAGDAYNVEFTGGTEEKPRAEIFETSVPAIDRECYQSYREVWRAGEQVRLGLKSTQVRTQTDIELRRQQVREAAENLLSSLDRWGNLPEFARIARAIADRSENLRITISTDCSYLRKLPFHKWRLFPDGVEVIFSGIEAKELQRTRHPDRIRILVILGDTTNIDIEKDRQAIEEYCKTDAEIVPLLQPDRAKLTATLADAKGWDIIFFSGHSEAGQISINQAEHLTMDELKDVLAPAIAKRVQIFIFNSCDGLELTPDLEKLNIDRLIVMRELIPDLIAQEFLKSFLKAFTKGDRFDDAVKFARKQLVNFEDKYPYVSWLPIVIQNRLVTSPTWQSLGKIRSPYKGLAAFTEADADNFYGREDTIDRYVQIVSTAPLVPIIGASGSGKSSLVQAGLIPFLKQDPDLNWQILTMRPGRNPFNALAKAISNDRMDLDTIELDIDLASDPHLLTQKLAQIRIPQHRTFLFIDQFEELFTQTADESVHQSFLHSLANAVNNAPNFTLVFTLRSDFLLTLQDRQDNDFRQLLERYTSQQLCSMTRDRLQSAITKPAETLSVTFESGLVDRILQDVGINNASLPLLQLVLDRLWDQQQPRLITHQGYDEICGDRGIKLVLANRAEEIYARFVAENEVKQFKQVFFRLVSIGNTTRRIATRAEIGEANWREIVVPLSTERLLITDLDEKTGVETVEIVHETLIQYWQRLQNWVVEYRDELEKIAEIETAAIKWNKNNRSKQDLWQGKKLKSSMEFTTNQFGILPLLPISSEFIAASRKQQVLNRLQLWGLGILIPGIVSGIVIGWNVRENMISEDRKTIQNADLKSCDRIARAVERLILLKYNLANINLVDRDLSCINLEGANFAGANLKGVNFGTVKMIGNFNYHALKGVNLKNTNFEGAIFSNINLGGADLSGANLQGADLNNADFYSANLSYANLSHANLSYAKFTNAILEHARLDNSVLSGAVLSGSHLTGTHFNGADFNDTNLENTAVGGQNFYKPELFEPISPSELFNNSKVNITPEQIKVAKNWEKAKYDRIFRLMLGLK
jgi:uncharacterized protein YjbI with pentapeptide repeats